MGWGGGGFLASNTHAHTPSFSPPLHQVTDPATAAPVASVARCGDNEARVAVEEAASAFPGWAHSTTPRERAAFLKRWHTAILASADDIATIMSVECGKPKGEARAEVASAAASVEWCAGEAVRVGGELPAPLSRGRRGAVLATPCGPAGLITPWNFPASMVTRKGE